MQKIKLMTDTASDIPNKLIEKYDIKIMYIPITIDGVGYHERQDFSSEEFYTMMGNAKELPTTSHITAMTYAQSYKKIYEQGFTDIINVTITSQGSNMFIAAKQAIDFFFEENPEAVGNINIHVVDGQSYSLGYGQGVLSAGEMIRNGKNTDDILTFLDDYVNSVEIYFCAFNLDNAKRSGRISCAAAFVGEMLGLRPIIQIIDGTIKIAAKVRGDKNVIPSIMKYYQENVSDEHKEFIMLSASDDENINELLNNVETFTGFPPIASYQIGASIAINSGVKVIGIVFRGKNRKK